VVRGDDAILPVFCPTSQTASSQFRARVSH
jgi:hypothetical protein